MTLEQKAAIEAFTKVQIHYPGKAKQFQATMKERLHSAPDGELSERSWTFLCQLLHTYRRQVPAHIHEKHCTDPKCIKERKAQKALKLQLSLAF